MQTEATRAAVAPGRRVVIMGLDGVPYSLLHEYMEQGEMPRLREMTAAGRLRPMDSTLPEVSSVAWTSFMTGKNPAAHGIFGFMELDPRTYDFRFPNFQSLKAPPLWEELGVAAVVCNIPQTYPARPLNGVMVSGFVALDLHKAVYPERVFRYLQDIDYQLDVKSQLAATDPPAFFDNLFQVFDKRAEALLHLYDHEPWQLFIGAITETDRLHHFFFADVRGGPHHDIFLEFYRKLDGLLWEVYTRAQRDGALFLTCSDHGFAPIKTEVYVNEYLKEQGLLALDGQEGLKSLAPATRAFCLEPARVYLHRRGKFARGAVEPEAQEEVLQQAEGLFRDLTWNGQPVAARIFRKAEIFAGPYLDAAPDLYVLAQPGFDLKAPLNRGAVFGRSHFTGAHTYADAHVFISRDHLLDPQAPFSIEQVPHLVRAYLLGEAD